MWPELWDAVRLFEACDAHWRVLAGMGGVFYQGLDMAQVDVVRRWMRIPESESLVWQLRLLVSEARQILNS